MFPIRLEIIPSEGIVEKIQAAVPLTTTLTITCLPHHGTGRTMRTAVQLSLLGYTVVPHLAARSLADSTQLAGIIRDCGVAGISEVFAVGGDAPQPAGPFANGGELLREIARNQRRPDGRWGRRISGGPSRRRPSAAARIIVGQAGTCLQRRHADVLLGRQYP